MPFAVNRFGQVAQRPEDLFPSLLDVGYDMLVLQRVEVGRGVGHDRAFLAENPVAPRRVARFDSLDAHGDDFRVEKRQDPSVRPYEFVFSVSPFHRFGKVEGIDGRRDHFGEDLLRRSSFYLDLRADDLALGPFDHLQFFQLEAVLFRETFGGLGPLSIVIHGYGSGRSQKGLVAVRLFFSDIPDTEPDPPGSPELLYRFERKPLLREPRPHLVFEFSDKSGYHVRRDLLRAYLYDEVSHFSSPRGPAIRGTCGRKVSRVS